MGSQNNCLKLHFSTFGVNIQLLVAVTEICEEMDVKNICFVTENGSAVFLVSSFNIYKIVDKVIDREKGAGFTTQRVS